MHTAALRTKAASFWGRIPHRETLAGMALAVLFTVFFVAVYGVRYEVNDDAIISNIAAGAYGPDSQYLIYVNALFGYALKPLYALAGGVNWFVILLFCGGVLCFGFLGAAVIRRMGLVRGAILFSVFMLLCGNTFITIFHYVKYAGFFIACGLLLLAQHLGQKGRGAWIGVALAILGSMLRFQMFAAVGGISAALLLWRFWKLDAAAKKRAVLQVGALCCLALALWGVDKAIYRATPGWDSYTAFNSVRTEILDFRIQYATAETLEPLGYSESDFETLANWSIYDDEVFDDDSLTAIRDALPLGGVASAVKSALRTGLSMLYGEPPYLLFSALLLGWLLFGDKKCWPAVLGTLALLALMVLVLHWRGRYMDRVGDPLLLAAVLFIGSVFTPRVPVGWRGLALSCALLALAIVPSLVLCVSASEDYWLSRLPRAAETDALAADKDTLYLLDTYLVDAANGYDVWHPRPRDYFSNLVFVGSWLMDSPFQNEALAAYGLENPYRDAIDREDVLLADFYNRELKEVYLQEHYSPTARVELVEEVGDFNLYRILRE